MKVSEFKKILKPIVEQTVKEVLLEQGVLSSVVTEVVKGLQSSAAAPMILTSKHEDDTEHLEEQKKRQERHEEDRQTRIRRLNESAGLDVFGHTNEIPPETSQSPLSGVSAADDGVDISGILSLANNKWKKLI